MFKSVTDSIVQTLAGEGINAVAEFPPSRLDEGAAAVCVSLKSARISASGFGNYIGLGSSDGDVRELYGSKAELIIALDIYSPAAAAAAEAGCAEQAGLVSEKIRGVPGLSITEFELGAVDYDPDSEMLRSRCTAKARALLVRELSGGELSDYGLGDEV